jgi:hypothetical protein
MILDVVKTSEAKVQDRYGLALLIFPKETIIFEDRAYCFRMNAQQDKG